MIPDILASRYASSEISEIWSPEGKVHLEREFWIVVMKAQQKLGVDIPESAIKSYEKVKSQIDLESISKRERKLRHDVKSRIEEFCDLAGHQHIHKGLTSRDLTDNVEQLQIFRSLKIIRLKAVAVLHQMASWEREYQCSEKRYCLHLAGLITSLKIIPCVVFRVHWELGLINWSL